jgi:threonine dehydratase
MKLLDTVCLARQIITPHIHRTPMQSSAHLSALIGREVLLKAELFQKTGSYKPRGMIWALSQFSAEQRAAGAITFSAGNAAQALAYAGRVLGINTVVIMAETANPTKVHATRSYGAEVIQYGTPQQAAQYCLDIAAERGLTFISSYDDDNLMNGHASLGLEILEDVPDAAAIIIGIGGGGMAGGLVKAVTAVNHDVALLGVEPEGAPAMSRSLAEGRAIMLDTVSTIADGLAAPSAGARCFDLVRSRFSDVLLVNDEQIIGAMKLLMQHAKLVVEPAGAAGLAGLIAYPDAISRSGPVVCVASGGNVDLALLKIWL